MANNLPSWLLDITIAGYLAPDPSQAVRKLAKKQKAKLSIKDKQHRQVLKNILQSPDPGRFVRVAWVEFTNVIGAE